MARWSAASPLAPEDDCTLQFVRQSANQQHFAWIVIQDGAVAWPSVVKRGGLRVNQQGWMDGWMDGWTESADYNQQVAATESD